MRFNIKSRPIKHLKYTENIFNLETTLRQLQGSRAIQIRALQNKECDINVRRISIKVKWLQAPTFSFSDSEIYHLVTQKYIICYIRSEKVKSLLM